jgi:uncharacterized SAM-binding protein YcdF (DUF218 family)
MAGAWLVCVLLVLISGAQDQARRADAIVVLGAAQYVGRPSPVLRARLDHAVELWRRSLSPHVILTGGIGSGDTTSEAAVGRRYLLKQGVPDSAMLLEDHGRSTRESMAAVAEMMRGRGMSDAILVSDPFHMLRLRLLARLHGVTVFTSPTRSSPISASRSQALIYVLSESVKVPLTAIMFLLPRSE